MSVKKGLSCWSKGKDLNQSSDSSIPEISFNEVMSEQLAYQILEKEGNLSVVNCDHDHLQNPSNNMFESIETETDSDLLLAQLLQQEYDREYDDQLEKQAKHFNGQSKVSLSFHKYRATPVGSLFDSDSDSDPNSCEDHDWDLFETTEKDISGITIGKQGFVKQGKTITTKHDPTVCGRRNACRAMDFDISTGDGGGFEMKLNNNVYNALKVHSMSENKRAAKVHEKKERSSAEQVVDEKTRLILYKLVNRGILEIINGAISTGKEAYVFHGIGGYPDKMIPTGEVAIKVFKTTLNEFKNREQYIKGDHRFRDKFSRQNPRKIIHLWAEKEMHNLIRMKNANILCPEVIMLKKHVLVMKFIGKEGKPAPSLKDANLNEEVKQCYQEVVQILQKLYSECKLIHGDFSEYNLLWHLNRVWVIDVSQSILVSHPNAMQFLLRDCRNVVKFFVKNGLENVPTCAQLFTTITGKEITDEISEIEFEKYRKDDQHLSRQLNINTDEEKMDKMFEKCFNSKETDADTKVI